MKDISLLRVAALIAVLLAPATSALSAAPALVATRLNQVSSERVNRTTYDYKFTVTFTAGASPVANGIGHVSSNVPGTAIVDGDVSIGNVPAGASVTPADTITIRQDLSHGFSPASLVWNFSAPPAGPVVQLNAAVADAGTASGVLSYRWKSTDGNIVDVNSPTTRWTLPPGRGLHFAYVLVSNNQGGITERRVAVNTDSLGTAVVVPAPLNYAPPAAPVPVGNTYRSWIEGGYGELPIAEASGDPVRHRAFLPDLQYYLRDSQTGAMFPPGGPAAPVKTDMRGQFAVHGVPPSDVVSGSFYEGFCSRDGGVIWSSCDFLDMPTIAYTDYIGPGFPVTNFIVGRFRLADDSICGMKNDFFGTEITGSASLLNASGASMGLPVRLSIDGDFTFEQSATASAVRITCQTATPVIYPLGAPAQPGTDTILGLKTVSNVKAPVITNMTAVLGATPVGLFLPPPSGFPSDKVPAAEQFLSFKGIDSRLSACQYYKTIGAVQGCDGRGNFIGAINVEDWRRKVKIGAYATGGTPEYAATFINQVDLNLTRNHHSISYGPNHTAAYVCNHLGPPSLDSTQAEINTAIDNAIAGKNLVACVMMDSIATAGVNGGLPYTRYLIFGPSGELLPAINLDGRREKFVPGVCVACHGGDKYAGKFPENGSGAADIGAHFLPYDIGNFAFSNKPGLTRADQELAIYNLNQNVLKAGATPAARDLIAGWYPGSSKVQNVDYLPPSWVGKGYDEVYHKVYAHSCRTCHVNMIERWNFDNYVQAVDEITRSSRSCNDEYSGQHRRWAMPNSLVTFNRFWQTKGKAEDLTALYAAFLDQGFSAPSAPPPCNLFRIP